jgi:hypothetical protein
MRCVVLAVAVAALTGCGGGVKTYPVEGQVVWADDTPAKELANGVVAFQTADAKTRSQGAVGADGSFKLADPLPEGIYQVYVSENLPVVKETDEGAILGPPKMDPRFGDPKTSGLTATVQSGGEPVTLKVSKAKRR